MFLKSPWSSMGVYKYKSPSKRRRDRLRKERFLAKFKRDPLLVPIPFLEPGQSPSPVALGGPVCSAITTAFMTQAEEMLQDMKDLCHRSRTTWYRRLVRLKRSGRRCVSRCVTWGQLWEESWRVWSKSSNVRKMSWHSLRPEKKCWRPLVLHLEYQSGLPGMSMGASAEPGAPKKKKKKKQKTHPGLPSQEGQGIL